MGAYAQLPWNTTYQYKVHTYHPPGLVQSRSIHAQGGPGGLRFEIQGLVNQPIESPLRTVCPSVADEFEGIS